MRSLNLKCNHCNSLIHTDIYFSHGPSRKCSNCRKKFDRETWKSVIKEYKIEEREYFRRRKHSFIYGSKDSLLNLLFVPITFPLYYISRLFLWSFKLLFKFIKYALIIFVILLIVNYFFDIDIFGKIKEFLLTTFS